MPLYSELYHNFVGNTPIIPTPMVSVGSSTYSPPTYVGVSRTFPNPLSSAGARTAPSSFTRGYVPKLTPITETPLTSTRIAALGRVTSPKFLAGHHHHHHSSPTYQKPRRTINTADIDVSASKYAGSARTPLPSLRGSSVLESSPAALSHYTSHQATSPPAAGYAASTINLSEGADRSTALSTRDQELSERSEQRRARSTINRNRTVVRLNTIRARSKSRGSRGSTEGRESRHALQDVTGGGPTTAEPTFDEEMLLLEPAVPVRGVSSWRDNFRDELSLRPRVRTEPSKSPGELLLEKHLIRDDECGAPVAVTQEPSFAAPARSPVPKRRGTIRRKSAVKIPSFHEICADISSDKLDDDLNAGELRRRASQLIEDELLQFQEELKKAANGAAPDTIEERLQEALEQQISQDSGVEVAEKRKIKKIKRTRTKVLPVLATPDQPDVDGASLEAGVVVVENAAPRIVAELESIEECTVFKLPQKKKKKPVEEASEGQQAAAAAASKQASADDAGKQAPVDGAGPATDVPVTPKPAKTGIKTYVRKKTVEALAADTAASVTLPSADAAQKTNEPEVASSVEPIQQRESQDLKSVPTSPPKPVDEKAVKPADVKQPAGVKQTTPPQSPTTPGGQKIPPGSKDSKISAPPMTDVAKPIAVTQPTPEEKPINDANKQTDLTKPAQAVNQSRAAAVQPKEEPKQPAPEVRTLKTKPVEPVLAPVAAKGGLRPKKPLELKRSQDEVDFWSTIGTRETVSFARRKQQLVLLRSTEEEESPPASPSQPSPKFGATADEAGSPGSPKSPTSPKSPVAVGVWSKKATGSVEPGAPKATSELVAAKAPNTPVDAVVEAKGAATGSPPDTSTLKATSGSDSLPQPSKPKVATVPEPVSPKAPKPTITPIADTSAPKTKTPTEPAPVVKTTSTVSPPDTPPLKQTAASSSEATPTKPKPATVPEPSTPNAAKLATNSESVTSKSKPSLDSAATAKTNSTASPPSTPTLKQTPNANSSSEATPTKTKTATVTEPTVPKALKPAPNVESVTPKTKIDPVATVKTNTTTPPDSPTVKQIPSTTSPSETTQTKSKTVTVPELTSPKASKPTPNTESLTLKSKIDPVATVKTNTTSPPDSPTVKQTPSATASSEATQTKSKTASVLEPTSPKASKPTPNAESVTLKSKSPTEAALAAKTTSPPGTPTSKATPGVPTTSKAKPQTPETPLKEKITTPPEAAATKAKLTVPPEPPEPAVAASTMVPKPTTPPEPAAAAKPNPAGKILTVTPIVPLDTKKLSPKELIKAIAPNIAAAAEKKLAQEKGKSAVPTTPGQPTVATTCATTATAASTTADGKKPTDEPAKKVVVKKVVKVVKTKAPIASKAKPKPEAEEAQEAEREQEQRRLAAQQQQQQQQQQQNLERMKTKLNQITLNMGVKGLEVEVKECQKCQSAIVSETLPVGVGPTTPTTAPPTPKVPKVPNANGAKLTKNKFGTLDNLSDLSAVGVRDRHSTAIPDVVQPGATTGAAAAAAVVKTKQQKQAVVVSAQKQQAFLSSSDEEEQEQQRPGGLVEARAAHDSASETSFSGVEDDWSSEEEDDDDDDMANDKPEKKKPFDPTKRVKLNFDQMRKCYSKEEKSPIVLVARPRPLWKVKRHGHRHNRKADLTSSSGSGSSSGSDDESTSTSTTTSSGATANSTTTTDQTSSEAISTMDGATSDINTDSSVNSSTGGKPKQKPAGKGQKAGKGTGAKGQKPDPFGDIYDNPMVIPLHAEPRTSSRKSGGSFVGPPRDENNNTPADLDEDERARSIGAGHEVRSASTSSHDSGFYGGGTAPISPKKALDCDVNCHKKCEKLAANLCGVNQKLIVEALASVRRGVHEARDSPSKVPPSANPAYRIETPIPALTPPDAGGTALATTSGAAASATTAVPKEEDIETSYTYAQFQKTGKLTAPATVIPRFRKYNVDDFHFLTVLGKGSFGKVFLAELKNSDYYYAIKCLKKDVVLEDDDVDCTLIERKVLALGTKHPFLCHLFCTFQTDSHLFFVMEYLNGGDLMFHIQQSGRFPEARARFYAAEIVSGLKFLHRKGIVYRDLKLDNVLLDYDGHVRIADFGMCKLEIYLDKLADSFCGTPDYMAPEIIKGQKYNQAVDWWSFGVLVYEMLVGQSPFSGCDEDELFWSICNEIPWFPHYLSKEALRLLQSLLEKDASIRLGVLNTMDEESDIKYHPFFNSIIWDKLERRAVEPPFKPQVRHPLDTQYFDKQFTRERARLTPIDRNILASMDQAQFEGFTYTNPNNTLT